ncbi:MAG: hypothetical protein FJY29_12480 [Betaproteobacteria bacterium]|nr:hypothetical protein [Betaproteobacteria bacterium]
MASLALAVACGSGKQKRVYLIDETRSVAGSLVTKNGFDPNNVSFSIIEPTGFRKTPESLTFDPATNKFSLNLTDDVFYKTQTATLIEQILSMGKSLPMLGLGDAGVVSKVEKYVRLEVRPKKLSEERFQIVPYLQIAVPLTRRNLYSGNDELGLGAGLELGKAGFVKLSVVNESGAPISGVSVAAVSDGKIASAYGEVPLWHEQMLRPVFTKTDANGIAYIGPIDASELAPYQILARAEGYCHFLSAPSNRFSLTESKSPVLTMRTCSKDSEAKNSLVPSFPTGLKYFNVADEGVNRSVVHTKDTSVFLRLDSTTFKYRGVRVGIYETNLNYEPKAEPLSEVREVSQYQGEFDLAIPKDFEGRFVIKVTRLPGALDGAQLNPEQFPDLVVFGKRSISLPSRDNLMSLKTLSNSTTPAVITEFQEAGTGIPDSIDYWKNVSVKSPGGFENVVNGNPGGVFTISSPLCKEGWELGFGISSLSIRKRFKPCVNNTATFTAEEAGLVDVAQQIALNGGRRPWQIFIKNEYGNESEALSSTLAQGNLNEMTVVIDTSGPLLGTAHPLDQLEFLKTGETTALGELSKADFEAGELNFRFKSFENQEQICNQLAFSGYENANGELGVNAELKSFSGFLYRDELDRTWARNQNYYEPGLQFVKYAIGATEAPVAAKPIAEFSACRKLVNEEVVPVETTLTAEHISFPAGNTGDAEFFLRVMDASGQLSAVTKYTIPRCPVTPAALCWKD